MRGYYRIMNASIGQSDPVPDWEQQVYEDTMAVFRGQTGRQYPENFEMYLVWLTLQYSVVMRFLDAERYLDAKSTFARWLTAYQRRLARDFADNPTWDRRAQEALARIRSPRSQAQPSSGYWY